MDLADDVAYSVHDVEDGVVAERVDLAQLDRPAVWDAVRAWYLPEADDDAMDAALSGAARRSGSWPDAPYDGSRRSLAALKNLTSDLIGRFCGAVQEATFAAARRAVRALPRRPRGARADPASRWRCSRGSPPTT